MAIKKIVPHHNFEPSLIIIIDDGDYTSKRKYLKFKNPHNATFHILMDEWKLVMPTWFYGYSCSGVA